MQILHNHLLQHDNTHYFPLNIHLDSNTNYPWLFGHNNQHNSSSDNKVFQDIGNAYIEIGKLYFKIQEKENYIRNISQKGIFISTPTIDQDIINTQAYHYTNTNINENHRKKKRASESVIKLPKKGNSSCQEEVSSFEANYIKKKKKRKRSNPNQNISKSNNKNKRLKK